MSDEPIDRLSTAREAIRERADLRPRVAMVLGSGLGAFADTLEEGVGIPYDAIPGWPGSTVEGHAGRLVVGRHAGVPVAAMQGRVHLYEGYEPHQVAFPVRVLGSLGCEALVVTNAAGAVNENFEVGDLMLIADHLNLMGRNPCVGPNLGELGPRFFDMTTAYSPRYRRLAREAAAEAGLTLREGVYAAMLGPSYETPAEIRMLRTLGADAVGMSTVPEVIAARHAGIEVVGISCMTNMAAGVLDEPLDHEEVMETAERVRDRFVDLVGGLVARIGRSQGWSGPAADSHGE